MKKLLAMALGAMLLVSAVPAFAASAIDFSGYYNAYYFTVQNNGRGLNQNNGYEPFPSGDNDSDNWFMHRLNVNVNFQATDEISVFWNFRGPDKTRWGRGFSPLGSGDNETSAVWTRQVYGQIAQDWGTVQIGRVDSFDQAGLVSLGYAPGSSGDGYLYRNPFDNNSQWDQINFVGNWDNFGLRAAYFKTSAVGRSAGGFNDDVDADADNFLIEGTYKWDGGGASLAFWLQRDYASSWEFGDPYVDAQGDIAVNAFKHDPRQGAWYVNPSIMHSWGDISFHVEGMFGWGKAYAPKADTGTYKQHDSTGYGFYADVDYNYGPGNVTLAGWFADGTGADASDSSSLVGMGDFAPLIVAYYGQSLGNGRYNDTAMSRANASIPSGPNVNGVVAPGWNDAYSNNFQQSYDITNNHWGIALSGKHGFTDEITMDWAVGYLQLVKSNWYYWDGNGKKQYQAHDLGWEMDLGFTFQLLDNLQYTTMFGYMISGNAFRYTDAQGNWQDADDSYLWLNTLSFSF